MWHGVLLYLLSLGGYRFALQAKPRLRRRLLKLN